jgi:molecular chaperone GrpE (heat shock protein)
MSEVSDWKVPKWPFLLADAILIAAAAGLIWRAQHPISVTEAGLATAAVALGSLLGCLPFILEYRATAKLVELNALGEVAEKIQELKQFTSQVSAVTDQWARVHETTQGQAEKTAAAAREITNLITAEVRDFSEFQKKMNDAEKGTLRLEVEKLRRVEGDWLQVVVRILDHIYSLHTAAIRSGQPELADQIGHFQNTCRDAARRVGLVPFAAEPDEPFDPERHRVHGIEKPPAQGIAAETLAPGLTLQGRLIRPALIRLQEKQKEIPVPAETAAPPPAPGRETPAVTATPAVAIAAAPPAPPSVATTAVPNKKPVAKPKPSEVKDKGEATGDLLTSLE